MVILPFFSMKPLLTLSTRECDNFIEGEQKEMVQLYEAKGLSKEDAETVIKIFSKNTSLFVDIMMKEELELMPPDQRNIVVNSM
jgi:hypothetical protein